MSCKEESIGREDASLMLGNRARVGGAPENRNDSHRNEDPEDSSSTSVLYIDIPNLL